MNRYTEGDETTDETKVRCVKQSSDEPLIQLWGHFSIYSISTAVILIIIAIFVIILLMKSDLCTNPRKSLLLNNTDSQN